MLTERKKKFKVLRKTHINIFVVVKRRVNKIKMINCYIKSLKLANHLILTVWSSPRRPSPYSQQRNLSTKVALQISCQLSIPAAGLQKAQTSTEKVREKWLKYFRRAEKHPKTRRLTKSKKHEEILTCRSGFKNMILVEIFRESTNQYLI